MKKSTLPLSALLPQLLGLSLFLSANSALPATLGEVFDENLPVATEDAGLSIDDGVRDRPEVEPHPGSGSGIGHQLCKQPITQLDVDQNQPYILWQPGTYCLAEDITVALTTHGDVIQIDANEVTLWLAGHTLQSQSTTDESGLPIGDTAIRILAGTHNVRVYGGIIEGFATGVHGEGLDTDPIHRLEVRDLKFEKLDSGIAGEYLVESTLARNSFSDCLFSIGVGGYSNGTLVEGNEIALGASPYNYQWGITGSRTQGLTIRGNTIIGDENVTSPVLLQGGISLYSGYCGRSGCDDPDVLGRDNIVEDNLLIATDHAIVVGGSADGFGNTVRFNRIQGGISSSYVAPPGYQAQVLSWFGISVGNEHDLVVHNNHIYSGSVKGYEYGVKMYGTVNLAVHNGLPALYDNETCGVMVPLEPPPRMSASQYDGGNAWEVCNASPQ